LLLLPSNIFFLFVPTTNFLSSPVNWQFRIFLNHSGSVTLHAASVMYIRVEGTAKADPLDIELGHACGTCQHRHSWICSCYWELITRGCLNKSSMYWREAEEIVPAMKRRRLVAGSWCQKMELEQRWAKLAKDHHPTCHGAASPTLWLNTWVQKVIRW
jgi:hypothetical protein